jgi:hypothetical protein
MPVIPIKVVLGKRLEAKRSGPSLLSKNCTIAPGPALPTAVLPWKAIGLATISKPACELFAAVLEAKPPGKNA